MRAGQPMAAAAALLLAGCSGPQHALDPRGPAAARIEDLWWLMFALASAVSVAVAVLLFLAIRRSRRRRAGVESPEIDGRVLVWGGGVIVPIVILATVLLTSIRVGNEVYGVGGQPEALTIEVIGHQFWWEVRYPGEGIVTANEIHLPVGVPVLLRVSAPDVIHSFWVPQLHGKMDMIPGQTHTLRIEADRPGRFRGQCAEYCGESHALMALWVVALAPAEFEAWLDGRRTAVPEPPSAEVSRGREVFFAAGCGECHGTRGAPLPEALGEVAPDLSNLASRLTLAAGTLPNTPAALRLWITDPERIKPGVRMPPTPLEEREMEALLRYLESLR